MTAPNDRIRRSLRQRLQSLQEAGVQQLPRTGGKLAPTSSLAPLAATQAVSADDRRPIPAGLVAEQPLIQAEMESSAAPVRSAAATLEVLQLEVAGCTRCVELARTRTQTVFGVGNPRARLCFMGEAPGADEDRLGEPFVGRAGQLLNKILEACRLRREDVYILNTLKCRPPGNRNPAPDEAANCRRFLDRQLELIEPEFICCLGAIAAQNLLATTESIGRLRGRVHAYGAFKVVCTYHPAYLLRNPSAKKQTWDDMKLLMREMGTPVD
ncbi:MAG: uracil-DNA glycosylase [Pirellulales bacterium]|nr:uracil-DNA glycosylase [Pirellulales bacterium]